MISNTTKKLLVLLIFVFVGRLLSAQPILPSRQDVKTMFSLNGMWKFKYIAGSQLAADSSFYQPRFNASAWSMIKVPGNWEMQGFAEPSYGKKIKEGAGLYRTTFTLPATWQNDPVYIAFDGVEYGYTLWVNGKQAGNFASAFNRQVFDISKYISRGAGNTLAVKVTTHPKGYEFDTNDDWALSGISRAVTLFSLPSTHLNDVKVNTTVKNGTGNISVNAFVETGKLTPGISVSGTLTDQAGKPVASLSFAATDKLNGEFRCKPVNVPNSHLWSAETPYLYTLHLELKAGNKVLQTYTDKVGIREISWADGVLKLNGSPIKLKGVTHHDISPVNGRAITGEELKRDLLMMRNANMNFVRTSHYPPNPRLLELCDSLGIYVMDEVPFGFGEEHLNDNSYLPNLLERARLTLWRDKNRPSVIIWSVGNENPLTDLGLKTGRYVQRLDPSRPYCFPQTPTVFDGMLKALPDSLAILDDHYPKVADLQRYAKSITKPMVASEYAHALGLDFNDMEAIYEAMYAEPKFAGGAVWEFEDQGLLRKAPKRTVAGDSTYYVWASRDSIYDTSTNEGMDGMVYSNRIPQVDYWQARKVYTPVKAMDEKLSVHPGRVSLLLHLTNRYDFLDLSTLKCKWQIFADSTVVSSGILPLKGAPHTDVTATVSAALPQQLTAGFYYLKLTFDDKNQQRVYEKSYPLSIAPLKTLLTEMAPGKPSKPTFSGNIVKSDYYKAAFVSDKGTLSLESGNGNPILIGGPFARVGRKPSMAQIATQASKRSKVKNTLWNPFILSGPQVSVKAFTANQLEAEYSYKPDSLKNSSLKGVIACNFSDSGYVHIAYKFNPEGKEQATETGLSFLIPASLTEFRWIGKGPYAAYPGKDKLSEYGVYHLNSGDLYFPGNRQNVGIAVFTDAKGNGFAIVANNANISVERSKNGLIVSHNATVSERFNKYEWPNDLVNFADHKEIKGDFTIVPISSTSTPAILKHLFGDLQKVAKPFKPFYDSYDQ